LQELEEKIEKADLLLLDSEVVRLRLEAREEQVESQAEALQSLKSTYDTENKARMEKGLAFLRQASDCLDVLEHVKDEARQLREQREESQTGSAEGPAAAAGSSAEGPAAAAAPASQAAEDVLAAPSQLPAVSESSNIWVQVASESAGKLQCGRKGILKDTTQGFAYFIPITGVGANRIAAPLQVPESWIVRISEAEAKRGQLPLKANCNHLTATCVKRIVEAYTFKPQSQVESTSECLAVDHADAGIAEVLYRLLPGPRFVCMPCDLSYTLQRAIMSSQRSTNWLDHGGPPPGGDAETKALAYEVEALRTRWLSYVERAQVICIPIFTGQHGGHFTLLVGERMLPEQSASSHCFHFLGSRNPQQVRQGVAAQFSPLEQEPLPNCTSWNWRYYDTLPSASGVSKVLAREALSWLAPLGIEVQLPDRTNLLRQPDSLSCGFYLIHYVEEEARVFLGERQASVFCDLEYRRTRINEMCKKLNSALDTDKSAV